jgi:hypothetical protein
MIVDRKKREGMGYERVLFIKIHIASGAFPIIGAGVFVVA